MNGGAPKLPTLAVELQRITELLSLMKEEEKQRVECLESLQDVMSKLKALGVYDLKGLAVGLSILNSEAGKVLGSRDMFLLHLELKTCRHAASFYSER